MAGKNKDASLNKRAFTSGLFKAADKGTVRCSQNLRVMASDCLYDYVTLPLA